ncbi:MAG: BPSS1780 family membrane protein [Proteobacteria bacterium]|nr:BPSS1780 family membrane protein [Pseudomonadota bacterium]
MNAVFPSPAPIPSGDTFNPQGRAVDAGRGWDWIVDAFALFRRQPGMWILAIILPGIALALLSGIPVLGSLANALLLPLLAAGYMRGCKDLDEGRTLELEHLLLGFKENTGNLVMVGVFNLVGWTIIIMAVVAVIGGGVFMGMMRGGALGAGMSIVSLLIAALLVAGLLVPLYMATWFAPALIVLHNMAPVAALKASFFACLRNWVPFTVCSVVLLVFCVIAIIPVGLGYLVLIPVIIASVYTAYRDIFCAG